MILKYLKLRTIRILRDKYLDDWTCYSVTEIRFAMATWYISQVRDFARIYTVNGNFPFQDLAVSKNTKEREERKIFLDWLEQEVIAGRK